MLKIKIDGDWDEEMIGTAFDNLEALLCGGGEKGRLQVDPNAVRSHGAAGRR